MTRSLPVLQDEYRRRIRSLACEGCGTVAPCGLLRGEWRMHHLRLQQGSCR